MADLEGIPPHLRDYIEKHTPDRTESLAHKILDLVRDTLVLKMPYFNRAILRMPEYYYIPEDFSGWLDSNGAPAIPAGIGTNGQLVFAEADSVIDSYWKEPNRLTHCYLHMLLHCIYRHPFHYEELDTDLWDLAADLACEKKLLELELPETGTENDAEERIVLDELAADIGKITAERIYHRLHEDEKLRDYFGKYQPLFHYDIHSFWMNREKEGNGEARQDGRMIMANPKTEEAWKKIGAQTKLSVQNREESMGMNANHLTSVVPDIVRDEQDYTEFLKSFARVQEELHINPDEFDYIYYHYGMELYGNMPLIEPLEYREAPKIHDFVIAIDTSGSCQGNAVRAFLNKTYSILKNSEIFTDRMNLHIIQCDSEIQKDEKIVDEDQFDDYMKDIEISGSGGTDFRPVFDYVDRLVKEGEFHDLRGLLYLTDGMGMFPEKAPDYRTAFILKSTNGQIPTMPEWAVYYDLDGNHPEGMHQDGSLYTAGHRFTNM